MITITPKKVRLSDIAQAADISLSTASMALSDHPRINSETKKLVQRLSKKFGYLRPGDRNSLLKKTTNGQKSIRFGFLIVGNRPSDDVFASLLHSMTIYAKELNVRLEVSSIENVGNSVNVQRQVSDFVHELDGLLIEGLIDKELLSFIEKTNIPYLVQGNIITKPGEVPPNFGHFISEDNRAMGYLGTGRLIACGHRRIGFICEKIYHGLWMHNWLAGYQLAHLDANLGLDPGLIHVAGETFVGGIPAARHFSSMANPPTAYLVPDFRIGASFINEMQSRGISIPRESIILGGVPDVAVKYHLESYPAICADHILMGRVSIENLYRLYQNPTPYSTAINIPFTTCNLPEPL
ncbi:MAG: LacI family DNA-binding transcriptional regulator [Phycisphaerae bacterium]